jgi:hypothetical protein
MTCPRPGKAGGLSRGGKNINLRILYQTPVLKLMNIMVFADSFLMIFIGVGMMGSGGIPFGIIYGLIGGITAAAMFDVAVIALIMLSTRDKNLRADA